MIWIYIWHFDHFALLCHRMHRESFIAMYCGFIYAENLLVEQYMLNNLFGMLWYVMILEMCEESVE